MAMGAMSVTVTVVAAAAGIYVFDKSHSKAQCHVQELGSRMRSSGENMVANVKKTTQPAEVVVNDKPWTSPSFSKTLLAASVIASHALIRLYLGKMLQFSV
ncbi:hypothetical protein OIU74_023573 [Salix koriyanagi]|uniref:Uncharacterized protein n=1 Tax=Salix koriyanagi TaxID=2511006 RepID=A0A9Q0WD00_9ROSI|nr:hypothetical protein OIU74_023573 [Salix koriyanagi]